MMIGRDASFWKVSCMFGTGFYDSEIREMGYPVE
jgi:hypothetical protein